MLLRLSHGLGEMVSAGVEPWRATMFNRAQEYENQVGCSNVSHSPHEQHELADKAPVEVMEPTIGTCGKLLSDTMVDAKDGQMLGKSFGCSCQTGAVQTAGDWSEFTQSVWLDKRMEVCCQCHTAYGCCSSGQNTVSSLNLSIVDCPCFCHSARALGAEIALRKLLSSRLQSVYHCTGLMASLQSDQLSHRSASAADIPMFCSSHHRCHLVRDVVLRRL
jgi:hypothetical protein